MTRKLFLLVLFAFVQLCLSQDPVPPTEWPPVWHSWVVTTVLEEGAENLLLLRGQLIAFDSDNQYACRYNEQNLLNSSSPRPVDICDYVEGYHYTINDTTGATSNCSGMTKIKGPLAPIQWPKEFLANAKYMDTTIVAQQTCHHFLAQGIVVNGQSVQMDIWTSEENGYPCQIHIFETGSKIHTNWAFDGFSNWIPAEAKTCTSPKVICSRPDWVCEASTQDTDALGQALQWICDPYRVDCDPINPGGQYYQPDTVVDHSNWAFNNYYQRFKSKQGEFACDFNSAGKLVPPLNPQPHPDIIPRTNDNFMDFTKVFSNDLICPSIEEK